MLLSKLVSIAGECSAAVAALTALITPLPYSCDFRPYFTIHDSEFQAMAESQLPEEQNDLPTLIGITNVFFIKVHLLLSSDFCCPFGPGMTRVWPQRLFSTHTLATYA